MSMRDYSFVDYGMVIDAEACREIESRLDDDWDIVDFAEEGHCGLVPGFTGETFPINNDGSVVWEADAYFDDDDMLYFGLGKFPALCKGAYDSIDAVVDDIRERTSKWLPHDFDIRSRLRFISGTYYG